MWDLVCNFMDSWSIPEVAPYWQGNLSRQVVPEVRIWPLSTRATVIMVEILHMFTHLVSCLSGMRRKANLLNFVQLTYLWVLLIHWKNLLWWLQTRFFPSLQWTTLLTRFHVMFLMMVLLCWHSRHCLKHPSLQRSGSLSVRSSTLSHEPLNFILLKRWITSKIRCCHHLWRSGEQWR